MQKRAIRRLVIDNRGTIFGRDIGFSMWPIDSSKFQEQLLMTDRLSVIVIGTV